MTLRTRSSHIRDYIVTWRIGHCSERVSGHVLAVCIGLLTGLAAWLLKLMIGTLSGWLTSGMGAAGCNWRLLWLPCLGIVITGLYQRHILRRNIEHGIERVQDGVRHGVDRVSPRLICAPMIASSMTLGFGGSAGSEGPIATIGAAIGSNVGRFFRLSPDMLRILIGCGAGAGIAGIFKAPVGGMLFTLEVLGLPLTTVSVLALLISCITSAMTAYMLSGYTYDVHFVQSIPFEPEILPYVLVLGLLCGLYSSYYSTVMTGMRRRLEGIADPLHRNIVAGVALAVMVFMFPTLYGEGYGSLSRLINGHSTFITEYSLFSAMHSTPTLLMLLVAAILVCKPVAACATNSGGGVAGDFAPTLFAGSMAGFLFALMSDSIFGTTLPTSDFAFIGMGAVMAGAVRAPLMALFLTSEMADGYQFFLPLFLATAISYGTTLLIDRLHHR